MTSPSVPAAEKQPHSMRRLPAHFTFGMVLCRWWAVPAFLQTWCLELRFIRPEPDHIIITVWGSFRCFFANTKCFHVLTEERIEFGHNAMKTRLVEVCPSVDLDNGAQLEWPSGFWPPVVDKALLGSSRKSPGFSKCLPLWIHRGYMLLWHFNEAAFSELFLRCVPWCKTVSELYLQLFLPQDLVFALCIFRC